MAVEENLIAEYCRKIEASMDCGDINRAVVPGICEIIARYIDFPEIEWFRNDDYFKTAMEYLRGLEDSCRIYILYYKVLSLEHSEKNKRIDKYVVSSMEKKEQYKEALQLIEEVLNYDKDQVAIRTLFRICRKLGDYSSAECYILKNPEVREQEDAAALALLFVIKEIGVRFLVPGFGKTMEATG